jgi:hypothetical protein
MTGCLGRLGCTLVGLTVLLVFAGGAFYTRHRWLPLVTPGDGNAMASLEWTKLSPEGATRARRAIERFDRIDGPVFANVSAADLASFLLDSATTGITLGERVVEATLRRDQILLRTRLRVGDLGADNLPLLGGVADKTATVVIGGTLAVARPEVGVWRAREIDVDAISVPGWAVPRVAREVGRYFRLMQSEPGAFQFALPSQVADVRVGERAVTLYKAVQ